MANPRVCLQLLFVTCACMVQRHKFPPLSWSGTCCVSACPPASHAACSATPAAATGHRVTLSRETSRRPFYRLPPSIILLDIHSHKANQTKPKESQVVDDHFLRLVTAMSSLQKSHEERAQSAAQKAADELHAARRDQIHDEAPASPRGGGGILGTVQESARSVMGAVQDTFSGSGGRGGGTDTTTTTRDSAAAAGEYAEEGKAKARGIADAAMGKATETKDAAAEKARGAMDAAAEKARGARDAAADKAEGAREYAAEKTARMAGDGEEEEDVMLRVKAADQMTGQAFNDVGPMGGEGTGMPGRRRSSG